MTDSEGSLAKPPLATRLPEVALAVLIGAAAYVARLVPVVRGGGLRGMNSYDGSVYDAAAAGLAHGLLPYRDFLFLHPPGIVVALVPFAALGRVIGDPSGIEVATLAWFGIGALNAVLVTSILRPTRCLGCPGWRVVLCGLLSSGLYRALSSARGPGRDRHAGRATALHQGAKGGTDCEPCGLAGRGTARGIGRLQDLGRRGAGCRPRVDMCHLRCATWFLLLTGAAIGAAIVCLPFFAAAPGSMWRMVVIDQLGRPRSRSGLGRRLTDMVGLTTIHAGLVAVALALAVAVARMRSSGPIEARAARCRCARGQHRVAVIHSVLVYPLRRSDRRPDCDHGRRSRRDAHQRRGVNWDSRTDHSTLHGRPRIGRSAHR